MSLKLDTKRLSLRILELEDIDSVMNFWGNEEVMKYCCGPGTRERLTKTIQFYSRLQNERGFSAYGVVLKENNEVIGACGFNSTENDHEAELIYHFSKKYWGKGYATEAAEACLNYAKKNPRLNKIVASVDPKHKSSIKVLEKLGFEYKCMKWFEDTKQEEPYFELIIEGC